MSNKKIVLLTTKRTKKDHRKPATETYMIFNNYNQTKFVIILAAEDANEMHIKPKQ